MNVLLLGSGAREHAIAWKLKQSRLLTRLTCAPGNPGMELLGAQLRPLTIPNPRTTDQNEIDSFCLEVVALAKEAKADLVVVGPEAPLALGVSDACKKVGIACFGPSKAAAQIEANKIFGKEVAGSARAPHGFYQVFTDYQTAADYVSGNSNLVIKDPYLAAGKGVTVAESSSVAMDALTDLFYGKEEFPNALIEDRLYGREVSAHAFCDGSSVVHMPLACDYKALRDGGEGPNTGGMGAYSPPTWPSLKEIETIKKFITAATAESLSRMAIPYQGVLYPGVMVTEEGPKLLEYNCRFGDPEAQVILPQLQSDLLEIFLACTKQTLDKVLVRWWDVSTIAVTITSKGYPNEPETGHLIQGLEAVDPEVLIFHGATRWGQNRGLLTAGGRVLTLVASGRDLEQARKKVYDNLKRIWFEGMYYRTDIALNQG